MDFFNSIRPMFPWEGLPLPVSFGFYWPWVKPQSSSMPSLNALSSFFKSGGNQNEVAPSNTPAMTINNAPAYENTEEIELQDIDPDLLMPRKIVVHRKYKKRVE